MLFYNTKLKKYSQELRKNMTDAERLLWSRLRRRQLKNFQFYRQRIIGDYTHQVYKNNIEPGQGYWTALPGSRRTMRRVFSQSLAAAPLRSGYMRSQVKSRLPIK